MEGFMEVELMVTKRDDNRQPTTDNDRVNIEQSASGRLKGRVLQYMKTGIQIDSYSISDPKGTDIKRFKCQEIALSA